MKKIRFILLKCFTVLTITNAQEKITIGSIEQLKPEMSKFISIDNDNLGIDDNIQKNSPLYDNVLNALISLGFKKHQIVKFLVYAKF